MTPDGARTPYRAAMKRLRRSFFQAGLFSAAINILMLTGPLYMLQIYDRVLASGSVPTLMGLFIIVVLLYAFLGAYDFFRARILSRAAYRFDKLVGEASFQHLLTVEGQGAGSSALRDLDIMRGFLSGPAIRGLFDVPWIPIFLVAVFIIHPYLGYLTLAGAGIVVAVALLTQWATKGPTEKSAQQDGLERGFTNQTLRNAEVVRALGMRGTMTARWRRMHDNSLVHVQDSGDRSDGFSAGSRAFRLLLQSMLLTGGAYLALQQQISAGMIVGTSILAGRALAPVDQVIGQWRGIARAFDSHKRLRAALDENAAGTNPVQLPAPRGAISLNGLVKFMPQGGQGERGRILDQVSFDLAPGDVLGVIGNSASGKSSLARMLVGAWQPDAGSVRLDGATLDQWAPDALGQHIGYLPQHVEMLPGTIGENISRFEPEAEEEQIFKAARLAVVHDLVLALPQGYGTPVGMPSRTPSRGTTGTHVAGAGTRGVRRRHLRLLADVCRGEQAGVGPATATAAATAAVVGLAWAAWGGQSDGCALGGGGGGGAITTVLKPRPASRTGVHRRRQHRWRSDVIVAAAVAAVAVVRPRGHGGGRCQGTFDVW